MFYIVDITLCKLEIYTETHNQSYYQIIGYMRYHLLNYKP